MEASLAALRIYTPHGRAKENPFPGQTVLDIGCGGSKLPGASGIDALALPAVDIVHNLDTFPWPLKDSSFDVVFASHYLEHATDVIATLGEIHRILKPGGRAVIQVPYFRCIDAVIDPTHKHFFAAASLDYVCAGTGLAAYEYTPFHFRKIGFWYGWPTTSKNPLARAFKNFIAKHTGFYDQYLSLIAPVKCLTWELERV